MQPEAVLGGGRFVIERSLARGGMGEVFVAHDGAEDRSVALKVLRLSGLTHRARFRREASVLERLAHPAIVRHIANGVESDGAAWLAMELIEGEDLRSRQKRAPLSLEEAIHVCARLADALAAAHALGIVHRDLKPSNIILQGCDPAAACLVDFGVARLLDGDGEESLTATTGFVGTPGYMAPEQARGAVIDARADLFSLGCVLYALAVGTAPFDGPDSLSILARLLLDPSPRIHARRPEVPLALDELVASLMAKEPKDRPPTAELVADALRRLGKVVGGAPARGIVRAGEINSSIPRLVSLVLGRADDTAPDDLDGATLAEKDADVLAQIAETHDARPVSLGGGNVLFTLTGDDVANDLAERAVRCARALRAVRPELAIAVGTGVGETSSIASLGSLLVRTRALSERADAAILLDGPTARLIGGRWDTVDVDGGHRLVGRATSRHAVRPLLGRTSPFVGRDGELALLRAVVEDCTAEPAPRVAMVFGEAGSGKTRLRHEVVRGATDDLVVWNARGDLLAKRSPLSIVRQLLRAGLELPEGTDASAIHRRIGEALRGVVEGEREVTAALVAELLGVPWTRDEPAVLRAARQDPRLLAEQMRAAFARFVAWRARSTPLLLSIDDLQWGDFPSLQYIDAALVAAEGRPLMALVLGRPDARASFSGVFNGRHLTALDLPPLSRTAVRALAKAMLDEAPAPVVDRLFALSGGNAFYLEELIRESARGGDLGRAEGLMPVIQARIDGLSPVAHEVLRDACVFGPVFWSRGVVAIAGDEARVLEGLAELQRRELVARRATRRFVDDDEWIVRNELVHTVAYALLRPSDRRRAHAIAAAWLAAKGESDALVLAEHFERGADPGSAARWLARAAEAALEANALDDAVTHAIRALALQPPTDTQRVLHLLLTDVHRLRGDFTAVADSAREAERCAVPGSAAHVRARAEMVAALVRLGRASEAVEAATALASVDAFGHDAAVGLALSRAAMALAMSGSPAVARGLLAHIEADQGPLLPPSRAAAHAMLALSESGDLIEYVARTAAALSGFELAGDLRSACAQRINLGYGYVRLGAASDAVGHLVRAVETATTLGLPHLRAAALHNHGLALALQGDHAKAIEVQREALGALLSQGDVRLAGGARCYLALSLIEVGALESARDEARWAVEALTDYPPMLTHAWIALARTQRAIGDRAEANRAARHAVMLTEQDAGARDARVAAFLELAEVLRDEDESQADVALAQADRALGEGARKIAEPSRREIFLTGVPEHARVRALVTLRRMSSPERFA